MSPSADNAGVTWRNHVTLADVAKVRHLVSACQVFNPEEIDIAAELVEEACEKGASSDYEFLFVETENRLAGYSCFGRIPFTTGRYDLYWIAIAPSFQGHGLAKILIRQSEEAMRRHNGTIVYIETSSRAPYEPARQLYQRCGYELAATLRDFYADGDHKHIFSKRL